MRSPKTYWRRGGFLGDKSKWVGKNILPFPPIPSKLLEWPSPQIPLESEEIQKSEHPGRSLNSQLDKFAYGINKSTIISNSQSFGVSQSISSVNFSRPAETVGFRRTMEFDKLNYEIRDLIYRPTFEMTWVPPYLGGDSTFFGSPENHRFPRDKKKKNSSFSYGKRTRPPSDSGSPQIPKESEGTAFFSDSKKESFSRAGPPRKSHAIFGGDRSINGSEKNTRIVENKASLPFLKNGRKRSSPVENRLRFSTGDAESPDNSMNFRGTEKKKSKKKGGPDQRSYNSFFLFFYTLMKKRASPFFFRSYNSFFLFFYTPVFSAESKVFGGETRSGPPLGFLSFARAPISDRRPGGFKSLNFPLFPLSAENCMQFSGALGKNSIFPHSVFPQDVAEEIPFVVT